MTSSLTQSVVLLDDEKSYTELVTQLLAEALRCPVHGFVRPSAALLELPRLRSAVIVTDFSMPEMNGIDFIRQAAPLVPGAVFVMITGNDLSARQDDLDRLAPLKGFLAKPFTWRVLSAEILRVWPAEAVPPPPAA